MCLGKYLDHGISIRDHGFLPQYLRLGVPVFFSLGVFFEVAVLRRWSGVDHSKFGVEVADIVAVNLGNAMVFTLLGQ